MAGKKARILKLINDIFGQSTLVGIENNQAATPPSDTDTDSITGRASSFWGGDFGFGGDASAEKQELLTPGTTLYKNWISRLDTLAGFMQDLKNAGVVFIFRLDDRRSLCSVEHLDFG